MKVSLWLPILLLACSSRRAPETTATPSPLAVARAHAAFAGAFRGTLTSAADGFVPTQKSALRTTIPTRSIEAVRIAHERGEVRIVASGIRDVAGVTEEASRIYRAIAPETDLVIGALAEGVEELRVLHGPKAPTAFRWSIEGGTPRKTERGVEIVDEAGVVRAATAVPFALDAHGVRRELSIAVEGKTIVAALDTRELAFPIVVDPTWTTLPSLRSVNGAPMEFALSDGTVVSFPRDAAPWVDIFHPATNTWTNGPDVPITWSGGSAAIQLASGDVLYASGSTTAFARFNASSKTWTTFGATQLASCNGCQLTRLNDGRIFKYPGSPGSSEIFNPATNTWSAAAAPLQAPAFGAVTLDDGRVIALEANVGQTLYIYSPSTNSWTTGPSFGRYAGARMVKLADGRVFVVGYPSGSGAPPPVGRVINATATSVATTYPFIRNRMNPAAVLLPSGRVMVAGGSDFAGTTFFGDAEMYDPVYNSFSLIDPFSTTGRSGSGITVFGSGSVLLAGGNSSTGIKPDAYRYDPIPDGGSCAAPAYPSTCSAPYCVDGVCCNSASCPGGTCAAPAGPGRPAGVCAKNLGQACTANADCASNFCVDGVCCNSACNGQCQACNLSPTPGTCRAVTGAPIGGRAACGGAGAGTVCGSTCNGVDGSKCNYGAAGTTACGTASCTGGTEITAGTCNGAGTCTTGSNPCGAYGCGATACKHSCAVESDCAAGNYCSGDKCVPKVGLGSTCTSTAMCPSGLFCTDGVCCGVASCGEGSSCDSGKATDRGTCLKLPGAACSAPAECGSRFCVDGVCCDRACDGQCEACDLTKGTCSGVTGAPRGGRAACDDGGGDKCKAMRCDGATDPTKCSAFANGGTVTCKAASCDGSTLNPTSTCDGAGSCVTPPAAKCGKYACDPAGASGPSCRSDCGRNADCAEGFFCVGGTCSEGARCSEDGLSSISTDGVTAACAPYRCGTDGTCQHACANSDECSGGAVCDLSAGLGACKAPEPVADSGGGCALGSKPGRGMAGLGLLAIALAAIGRRRKAI